VKRKKMVGYFEGTDSPWLTTLIAQGWDTMPVSNGYDGHGKNVALFTSQSKVDVVIGYLHKVIAPLTAEISTRDILHACITYDIPVLLACPEALQGAASKILGELGANVQLVDPAEMLPRMKQLHKA
jgi:hypothetical protein